MSAVAPDPASALGGVFDVCGPLPSGTTVLEASAGTGKTFTIAALATRFVADLPAGGARLVHEAAGYRAVIVGGEVVLRDGVATGARPGAVLRPAGAR